jgi:hypothetical protein
MHMVTVSSVGPAIPGLLCDDNPSPELVALIGELPAMDRGSFESWRRDVEMGRLLCDMVAEQIRRAPPEDPTQPTAPRSIAGLLFLKSELDHAPANIEAYGAIIEDLGQQLGAATDAGEQSRISAFIGAYARSRQRLERLVAEFEELVAAFEAEVRSAFVLTGHILVRQADGGYEWGCFSLRDPRTGRLVCRHAGHQGAEGGAILAEGGMGAGALVQPA